MTCHAPDEDDQRCQQQGHHQLQRALKGRRPQDGCSGGLQPGQPAAVCHGNVVLRWQGSSGGMGARPASLPLRTWGGQGQACKDVMMQ